MITEEEYLKAKAIVDEYENQQYTDGMNNAMYCTECQALEAHDCFCEDEPIYCECCGGEEPTHLQTCLFYDYED